MGGRLSGLGCWVLKLDRTKSVGVWCVGKNENHKKIFFIYITDNYLKCSGFSKTQQKLIESRRCKVCIKLSY